MLKSFITNRNINLISIHSGILVIAEQMGFIFMGVYLYQVGLPLWQIFVAWSLNFFIRLIVRPLSIKSSFTFGLKTTLIIGAILYATVFSILTQVQGIDYWLAIFLIVWALTDCFYWLTFHTFFALHGDNEKRGKQMGFKMTLMLFAQLLAPLIAAILISISGFNSAFFTSAAIMFVSIIPLFFTSNIKIKKTKWRKANKSLSKEGFWVYIGDAIFYNQDLAWRLFLFIFISDVIQFGGLLSLAILFQMILSLFVGHFFDGGKGKNLLLIGMLFISIAELGRALFIKTIPEIIFFDLIFMLGLTFYRPTIDASLSNISKSAKHTLWYNYNSEIGWDIGSIFAALLSALILYIFPEGLRYVLLISFLGFPLIYIKLKKYLKEY